MFGQRGPLYAAPVASLGWCGNCLIVGVPAASAMLELPVASMGFVDRGIMGVRYGASRPHRDIPAYLQLYRNGALKLDELVTPPLSARSICRGFRRSRTMAVSRARVFVF